MVFDALACCTLLLASTRSQKRRENADGRTVDLFARKPSTRRESTFEERNVARKKARREASEEFTSQHFGPSVTLGNFVNFILDSNFVGI